MLLIELRINYKMIRTIGVHNVYPEKLPMNFTGVCQYNIYDFGDFLISIKGKEPIGQVKHKRSEGAEILAQKVLKLVIKYDKQKESRRNKNE